jgi:23S rRNA pseudouridine2605 synthase
MVLERVQKIISNSGYCSRRAAEDLIFDGKVKVNDKIIKLGDKADANVDQIEINDNILKRKSENIYLMLNKPKYYVTTTSDPFCKKTVIDLIHEKARLYPIGRLDALTSGLLLFTNDGDFANKIMHPRYEKEKTYHVWLDSPLDPKDKNLMEQGIRMQDFESDYCKIVMHEPDELDITIHEGKNKEIKKMFKYFGYHVRNLHRFKIGSLVLDVPLGEYRHLTKKEVASLYADK